MSKLNRKIPRTRRDNTTIDKTFAFPFHEVSYFLTIGSIIFFFYDVISDIILAHMYFLDKRWIPFGFTTGFIVLPLLILNIKSLRWYYLEYKNEKMDKGVQKTHLVWFLRVVFTFPLMMGIVVRHIKFLYHGWKSKSVTTKEDKRVYHYRQMLYENTDAAMMTMFEALLESAPQLVLQMYIILTESYNASLSMSIVRPIAMIGSWIGVSWSLVAYQRAVVASHNEKESRISVCGTVLIYIWRSCEVGPRMVILALCAAEFQYYICIAVALHWIVMTVWVAIQKPELYENDSDNVIFYFGIGYVLIFCFQNVKEGHTRYRAILYYCVVYIENIAMLVTWLYFTSHKSDWFYLAAMIGVPSCMIIHICVKLFYYKHCHSESDSTICCLNQTTGDNVFHQQPEQESLTATTNADDDQKLREPASSISETKV